MYTLRGIVQALSIALLLAGCNMEIDGSNGFHAISIHDGSIAVHAIGVPDAIITPPGDLSIDGNSIALTPDQRALLVQYYAQVMRVRDEGIATGKAGAAMAGHVIGSVASGLAHGNPDSIGPAIDAHASELETKAMVVCNDAVSAQAMQDAIAKSIPAFKPYARIGHREFTDCHKHQG